VPPERVECTR